MNYIEARTPVVILAGKEYGSGSSRDWAAKGTVLLGVRAVIAESYERIHRSNLIGMGLLPLQFPEGQSADSLGLTLTGEDVVGITGVDELNHGIPRTMRVKAGDVEFDAIVCIDTPGEADYYRHGGIIQYVLRQLLDGVPPAPTKADNPSPRLTIFRQYGESFRGICPAVKDNWCVAGTVGKRRKGIRVRARARRDLQAFKDRRTARCGYVRCGCGTGADQGAAGQRLVQRMWTLARVAIRLDPRQL
jgi:hypothetical protein